MKNVHLGKYFFGKNLEKISFFFDVSPTFLIFIFLVAVKIFDILINSSFNENGGISGLDEGKITNSQKCIFFFRFDHLVISTP